MINHFKAEFYKLRHSKILITILGVCAAVIMVQLNAILNRKTKKLLLMMNCTNPIIEIHDHNFMITIDFSPLLIKK